MDRLKQISAERIRRTPVKFNRYLMDEIHWSDRLIGISGARGVGKTTLMLQYMKSRIPGNADALYVSLDDIFFTGSPLVYFAEEFYKQGGTHLFLDEVHKYPNWSQELKNIYDNLPGLNLVFSGSSALDIYKGSHDLSRRAMVYALPGLSFREFIALKHGVEFPRFILQSILESDKKRVWEIVEKIRPLKLFWEYLQHGYYPFFHEGESNYASRLMNIVNLVLEVDIPAIHRIDFFSVQKIKKLLAVIANLAPYKPNIQKLAIQTGTTRDSLLKYLFYLEKSGIVNWLTRNTSGINYLNKPDKLYLQNSNLMYALTREAPEKGATRETFFLNQLQVKHQVHYPGSGDFLVDNKFIFEIGGASKTRKQIAGIWDAFVASDDIEYPQNNKIPLWLFGFLY
ncbi:MAG: AAA family ATPase [Bacteroidetes bacterium]|nr:MAG: AAA family ATPase [Bacteroidota bacterium]